MGLPADAAGRRTGKVLAIDIDAAERPSFITNDVEAEAHALLLRKLGRALAREWLRAGRSLTCDRHRRQQQSSDDDGPGTR